MTEFTSLKPTATVVVIHNSQQESQTISRALEREGLNVQTFESAKSALERMETNSPPALIITGLYMPGIDGWRFCRLIKSPEYAPFNHVPILVISATVAEEEAARIAADLGANGFLSMPASEQDLLAQAWALIKGVKTSKRQRVLIVDDDANWSLILQGAFEINGCTADVANSGSEAEAMFATNEYDIVVLDHDLPDTVGCSLLSSFKERRPGSVYLAVSGVSRPEIAVAWMNQGASAFVAKPCMPEYLIDLCFKARREQDLLKVETRLETRTRELRLSEQRLKAVLHTTMDGFWMADQEGKLVQVNETYCRMSGYSESELLSLRIADLEADKTPQQTLFHLRKLVILREDRFESRHRRKDGSIFDVEISIQFRPIDNGLLVAFLRDITERKRAEKALLESEQRYRVLFDRATVGITLLSDDGKLIAVNESFAETHGYTVNQMLYMTIKDLDTPDSYNLFPSRFQRVLNGESLHFEVEHYHKDGHVLALEASASLICSSGKSFVQCFYRDISERKKAEAEKSRLEAQIHQAQKMEAIGQLAGGLAHDFNNILAAAMMQLSILRRNPKLDPEIRLTLAEILSEAKRASGLTAQLQMFSRRSSLEIRVLDLNDVVGNLLKMLEKLVGEQIEVRFHRCNNLPAVEADLSMVEQTVMNLVLNARDAMPKGGKLGIRLESVHFDREHEKHNLKAAPGAYACLIVTDTGCGMEPSTLQHIFEPYFTTKEPGKGTGLGLATVYGILSQHKGWVDVESESGKGAIFRVYFPASAKLQPLTVEHLEISNLHGNETILLVEDDEKLRQSVVAGLRVMGYRVLVASNANEAMLVWHTQNDVIDLLFTDNVLPGHMTGLELAKTLRMDKPNLSVVLCSGYESEIPPSEKAWASAIVFLPKPFEAETLSTTIRMALDRK